MSKKHKKSRSGSFFLEMVKKNLPWAALPLTGAILFILFFQHYTGPDSAMYERAIFIFFAIGGVLAGLAGLFLGWRGTVLGYGFVTVLSLPQMLPEPWNRYFSVVYLALLFGGAPLYNAIKGKTQADQEEEISGDFQEPEEPALSGCIFVLHDLTGRVYQLVRWGGALRAYRVGGELRGIYEGSLVDPQNPRPLTKGDLEFPIEQIRSLKIETHHRYGITARLRLPRKRWSCNPYITTTPKALEAFLCKNLPLSPESKAAVRPSAQQLSHRRRLRDIRTYFYIATGAIYLPWLFLKVPYKLFSVLGLLLFPAVVVFSSRNVTDVTLEDDGSHSKIEMLTALCLPALLPMFRTLSDFDFLSWQPVLLWTLGMAAGIFAVFLLYLRPLMEKFSHVLLVVILCLSFGFSAVSQLNYLLDRAEPATSHTAVVDLHTSTSRSGTSYYVTVILPDGREMDIRTSEEHYAALAIGGRVTVYTYEGGLGLAHVVVK